MGELSNLPNIGKEAGVNTYDELKDLGTEQAWLKIPSLDKDKHVYALVKRGYSPLILLLVHTGFWHWKARCVV